MGITGLISFVNKASREVNVRNFGGYTAAVDAYCWIHRGAFSCAERLVKGEKTDGYVHYCMKMVNVLLAAKVTPILVFDGRNLPSKEVTESKRRETREKNRNTAKDYLRQGMIKEAREWFQRSIDVTPQMALDVIQSCRDMGIDCIVAPYEADAQLAYLIKRGIAQLVITEDSDLIAFGCERVLLKMDVSGRGVLVERCRLHLTLGTSADKFTFDKFRYMCIMAGCDYLPSLPGIGLKKSFKFFTAVQNPDLDSVLGKIPQYLNMPKLNVTKEYREGFLKANNTFLYQLVFDPIERRLTPLCQYPPQITGPEMIPYAGPSMDNKVAFQIAIGNMNVTLMKPMAQYNPDVCKTPNGTKGKCRQSIWDRDYKPEQVPCWAPCASPVETPKRKPTSNTIAWVDTSVLAVKCSKRPRLTEDASEGCTVTNAELSPTYGKAMTSPKRCRISNGESEVILETPEKCLVEDETSSEAISEQPKINVVVRSRFFASALSTDNAIGPVIPKTSEPAANPLNIDGVISLYSSKPELNMKTGPAQNLSLHSLTGESNSDITPTRNQTAEHRSSPTSPKSNKQESLSNSTPNRNLGTDLDLPIVISPEPNKQEQNLEVTPERNVRSGSGSFSLSRKKNQQHLPNGILHFDLALASWNASAAEDGTTSKFFRSPPLGNFAWKDDLKNTSSTCTPTTTPSRNPFKVIVPSRQDLGNKTPNLADLVDHITPSNAPQPAKSHLSRSNNDSEDEFQDGSAKSTPITSLRRSASTPCTKGSTTTVAPKLRSIARMIDLTKKKKTQKAATRKGEGSNLKQLDLRQALQRFQFKQSGQTNS